MNSFNEKYKEAVKNNFNFSQAHYMELENKYAYFVNLTKTLLDYIEDPPGWVPGAVLDVGCGTGSSIAQLKKVYPQAQLSGLDISENMIGEAKKVFPEVNLVCGDGELLTRYFTANTFDLIVYPASLFLMPNQEQSLQGAWQLLKSGGVAAASILLGLKEKNGRLLDNLPDFKGIIKNENLPGMFEQIFPRVKSSRIQVDLDESLASTIYKIEALSAGVFPGRPYEDRVLALQELIKEVKAKELRLVQEWLFIVGYKA